MPLPLAPIMTLAISDTQAATPDTDRDAPVALLAPRHYQERAVAAFEDAQLLLSAILPDARIEHVGASAVPGAYSRGGVDLCVVVPRDNTTVTVPSLLATALWPLIEERASGPSEAP